MTRALCVAGPFGVQKTFDFHVAAIPLSFNFAAIDWVDHHAGL
jgi:hypothetical protein